MRCGLSSVTLLLVSVVGFPAVSNAVINIPVPNGDFSQAGNVDSETAPVIGLLGNYDREFGTGPWSVDSNGVDLLVTDLAAPAADIDQTNATIGGLASINVVLDTFSNSASIYQDDIGATFNEGWTYTLTATVTAANLITVDLLNNAGIGIGLRHNGGTIFSGDSGSLLTLSVLGGGTSSELTYTFTSAIAQAGDAIGVDLYVGNGGGLADIGLLGAVSFDDVTLTAVPEPRMAALLFGLVGLGYVGFRRGKGDRKLN